MHASTNSTDEIPFLNVCSYGFFLFFFFFSSVKLFGVLIEHDYDFRRFALGSRSVKSKLREVFFFIAKLLGTSLVSLEDWSINYTRSKGKKILKNSSGDERLEAGTITAGLFLVNSSRSS